MKTCASSGCVYSHLSDLVVVDLKAKKPISKTISGRCYLHAKIEARLIEPETRWPSQKAA